MHSNKENLQVLYEDNHLIVINKRIGDIVQGDKTGDKPLSDVVKEYLGVKYNKPGKVFLGVTHRLDRPTSGIVVFAKTSKSLERLNKMFREKSIEKTYWALVEGRPDPGERSLIHHLKKNPKNNKSSAFSRESSDTKKAILHFKTLLNLDRYSLLEINLETGRHHQIRCQLSVSGNPIKGDLKYGSKRSNQNGGIYLHAARIKFIHPVKKEELIVDAPVPEDELWKLSQSKLVKN